MMKTLHWLSRKEIYRVGNECEDVDDPDKREDANETVEWNSQACIQLSQYRSLRSFGLLNPSSE